MLRSPFAYPRGKPRGITSQKDKTGELRLRSKPKKALTPWQATGNKFEIDGAYGEVKTVGMRAVHIVTLDDTEVIVPHSRLWSKNIFNATSGNHSLLCVADFYLHPEHDAATVRRRLTEIAMESEYLKPETSVAVTVKEKPWGTHYRLKAYVKDSRKQSLFTTDLTVRGKEALTAMGMRFAQATYAETKSA